MQNTIHFNSVFFFVLRVHVSKRVYTRIFMYSWSWVVHSWYRDAGGWMTVCTCASTHTVLRNYVGPWHPWRLTRGSREALAIWTTGKSRRKFLKIILRFCVVGEIFEIIILLQAQLSMYSKEGCTLTRWMGCRIKSSLIAKYWIFLDLTMGYVTAHTRTIQCYLKRGLQWGNNAKENKRLPSCPCEPYQGT